MSNIFSAHITQMIQYNIEYIELLPRPVVYLM